MSVKSWIKEKCDKAEEGLKNFGASCTKFVDEHPRLVTTSIITFFVGLPVILGICLPASEDELKELSDAEKEGNRSNYDRICDFMKTIELEPGESFDIQINPDGTGNKRVTHTYAPVIEADDDDITFVEDTVKTIDVEV